MPKSVKGFWGELGETALLALPVAAGQIGNNLIGMTDTYMVGQLGKTELAAAALANSLFFVVAMFGIGACMAVAPVVAQARGREDHRAVSALLPQAVWVALASAVVMMATTTVVSLILPHMGQEDPLVAPLAQRFMWIIIPSFIPMLMMLSLRNYVDAFDRTWPGMVATYGIVVLNYVLNEALIYGRWGFPELGMMGSAWATTLSRTGGMLLMAGYLVVAPKFRKELRHFRKHLKEFGYAKTILKIGIPTGSQYFFEALAFALALVMMGTMGSAHQSAHTVALQLAVFTYMIYGGISAAAAIRTGKAWGAKDVRTAHRAGISSLVLGLMVIAVVSGGMYLLRFQYPRWFVKESEWEVIALASKLLVIGAFFQLFDGVQTIMQGALRGINDVKLPVGISVVAYLIIGLPLAWLLGIRFDLGAEGIWYGLTLGLAVSASFLTIRFMRLSGPAARLVRQNSPRS
jgi:MATE family multidrug resistance protein